MRFTSSIAAAILAFTATGVLAAALPQLAGEGAACDSVLSQTDNGVGYGVENAEDNTANSISSTTGGAKLRVRLLAGEGAACDSVFTQTDNSVGYGVENAEDNTANTITSLTGGKAKRQLDKIANGAAAIGNAAGVGAVTDPVVQAADKADGTSTAGAANLGAQIRDTEAQTLENAGSQVPRRFRRQLDNIANGAGAIGIAAGVGAVTDPVVQAADSADGTLTSGAANLRAQIGDTEAQTLENAGS